APLLEVSVFTPPPAACSRPVIPCSLGTVYNKISGLILISFCLARVIARLAASNLHQLQRFLARAFDHHGSCVSELVGAVEEFDAFALELVDPGVEVADAEPDMVLELAERADQRLAALVGVPHHRHAAEFDPGPRSAKK